MDATLAQPGRFPFRPLVDETRGTPARGGAGDESKKRERAPAASRTYRFRLRGGSTEKPSTSRRSCPRKRRPRARSTSARSTQYELLSPWRVVITGTQDARYGRYEWVDLTFKRSAGVMRELAASSLTAARMRRWRWRCSHPLPDNVPHAVELHDELAPIVRRDLDLIEALVSSDLRVGDAASGRCLQKRHHLRRRQSVAVDRRLGSVVITIGSRRNRVPGRSSYDRQHENGEKRGTSTGHLAGSVAPLSADARGDLAPPRGPG